MTQEKKQNKMEIKQLKNGIQERAYADHIWLWEIKTDKPANEVLDYCRKKLRNAKREEKQYLAEYRASHQFDKSMEIICGGYYSLSKTTNGYLYKVVQEYIA